MTTHRPAVLLLGDTLSVGGTEGQFAEIACGLDRSRWDVHVSCLRPVGPLRARFTQAGIDVWGSGCGSFKSPRFLLAVAGLVRYLRRYRIQLLHSFDFYSNILGTAAGRLAGVPVIASQRELGDLRPAGQWATQRLTLFLADHVVVNSPAVADRLRGVPAIPSKRITVIPNGVDVVRFSPAVNGRADAHIGIIANLRPEKAVHDLVGAMIVIRQHSPEARLSIWGDGPLRSDLSALVRRLGLDSSVVLRGQTNEPEVVLRSLSIFAFPSRSEACPNVLLEAMATGLPVVASRVGGNARVVQDEVTGLLVPPADPQALAKAIIRLVEAPAMAEAFGTRARAFVAREFSVTAMIARIETLYDRVRHA